MEIKNVKLLVKYVRNKKGHPIGVVVAIDKNKIGWSMCHKDDKWNKEFGKNIAVNRAWEGLTLSKNIEKAPLVMSDAITEMYTRANKYYTV